MQYSRDDYARNFTRRHLTDHSLSAGLEGLSTKDLLAALPPREAIEFVLSKGVSPTEFLKALPPELLEGLLQLVRAGALARSDDGEGPCL